MNGNYGWGLPVAASTYAKDIDFGIWMIHWLMIAIFILWGIFFTYLLTKYRKRPGVPAERDREGHGILGSLAPDIIVMVVEIVIIVFYAIPVWSRIKMRLPEEKDSVTLDIVAEQFAWNVHYPGKDGKLARRSVDLIHFSNPLGIDHDDPAAADDVVLANEIHLPTGKPALIRLTSKDVIHSFAVAEFRIKQDAVPGMQIPVWVEPNRAGEYEVFCAQLCGFAHALMKGKVVVHEPAEFEQWLASRSRTTEKPAESW